MRLKRVTISGFLSYGEEVDIDLEGVDYASIVGRNGAGKSTIPLAITWALFGTLRVRGDSDSVVNEYAWTARVALDVVVDGEPWRIVRTRDYDKAGFIRVYSWDADQEDWVQFGDHLNKTAQAQVDALVGMDEDAWYSLVLMDYFTSGGGTRFIKAHPDDRRTILMNLTPELRHWSSLEGKAVEMRRDVRRTLERTEATVEDLQERVADAEPRLDELVTELDDLDAEQLQKDLARLDHQVAEMERSGDNTKLELAKERLRSGKEAFEQTVEGLKGRLRELALEDRELDDAEYRAKQHRETIQKSVENLEAVDEELAAARGAVENLEKAVVRAARRASSARSRHDAAADELDAPRAQATVLRRQLDALGTQEGSGSGACLVCEAPLSEQRLHDLVHDSTEELARVEAEIAEITTRVKVLKGKTDVADMEHEKVLADRAEAKSVVERLEYDRKHYLQGRKASEDALELHTSRTADLRARADLEADQEKVKGQVDDAVLAWEKARPDLEAEVERIIAAEDPDRLDRLRKVRRERKDVTERIRESDRLKGVVQSLTRTLNDDRKLLKERRAEVKSLTVRLSSLDWLVKAFHPKGIPAMLLDSVLNRIEDEQNRILATIPGSEGWQVEFRQTRETKTAGTKDTLDIWVHRPDGKERPVESFSAGELVRLSISNLFAMISVFKSMSPGLVETVFLDEPLGPLDQDAVPALVDVLRTAMNTSLISSIMVVTHDQKVIDALPQRIDVSRDNEGNSVVDVVR